MPMMNRMSMITLPTGMKYSWWLHGSQGKHFLIPVDKVPILFRMPMTKGCTATTTVIRQRMSLSSFFIMAPFVGMVKK